MAKAATKKERKPRGRRPRPQYLPSMEPPSVPEIDEAAYAYVELRDERMRLTAEEVKQRTRLEGLMAQHELTNYEVGDFVVVLEAGEPHAKVRRKKAPPEADGEGGGDEGGGDEGE